MRERKIVDKFHRLYFDAHKRGETWMNTFWMGVMVEKYPQDLWIYQEIIYETRPDVIVETGTFYGGSALFLASICELIDSGKVITIDTHDLESIEVEYTLASRAMKGAEGRPPHKRITYLRGSSISEEILKRVKQLIKPKDRVMVILDSDHEKNHVLNELRIYSELVTKGGYLRVEDTCLNGNPVMPEFGPGPKEAVEEFLRENSDFIADKNIEKFYITANPGGYLRKTLFPLA